LTTGVIELRIFVTGATGLIGANLIQMLSSQHTIYAITRNANNTSRFKNVEWICQDFSKEQSTDHFPEEIDAIIHLAQSENFKDFPNSANDIFNVNVTSTQKLLDYAKKHNVKSFLYASSGGVYGYGNFPFNENQKVFLNHQLGFYITSKLCSELLTENYSPFFNTIILRFFFVYGPGQKKNMLVPRLVDSIMESKPITLQGNHGIRINPTFVDDAANAICNGLNLNGNQIINVAGPEIITLREIGETIGKLVGKDPIFDIQENVFPNDIIADITKMSELLGKPKISFKDGIKRYIDSIH